MSSPVRISFEPYAAPKRWRSDIGEHVGIGDVVVTCAEHGEVVRFMTTSSVDREYPATHGNAVLSAANHMHFEHAAFALIHIHPDGTERRVSIPMATKREAAVFAGRSLYDNGRAAKREAQEFSARLAALPLGEALTHEPSGYAARIERARTGEA